MGFTRSGATLNQGRYGGGFTTALRPELCDWGGDSCTVMRVGFMHIVRLNNDDIQDPNGWQ